VADTSTLAVDNITIVINFLSGTLCDLSVGELRNDISVLINDIALTVNLSASSWVAGDLFLLFLPSLCLTEAVSVTVLCRS